MDRLAIVVTGTPTGPVIIQQRLPIPTTSRRQPTLEPGDLCTAKNIQDLARVITSEAGGENETAQKMVGWSVVNRLKIERLTQVSDVWQHYVHSHYPHGASERLAKDILDGTATDISQGVTHFYTPNIMPKEGEATVGKDVGGGLEQVRGMVDKNGQPVRSFRPGWVRGYIRILVPGVEDKVFKFYK